ISPERIDVRKQVEEIVSTAAPDPSAVEIDVPEDTVAIVDRSVLERVLTNLVTNAFRYGEPPVRVAAVLGDGHRARPRDRPVVRPRARRRPRLRGRLAERRALQRRPGLAQRMTSDDATRIAQLAILGEAAECLVDVAIFVWDDDRNYVAVNDVAVDLVGRSREEILRMKVGDMTTNRASPLFEEVQRVG